MCRVCKSNNPSILEQACAGGHRIWWSANLNLYWKDLKWVNKQQQSLLLNSWLRLCQQLNCVETSYENAPWNECVHSAGRKCISSELVFWSIFNPCLHRKDLSPAWLQESKYILETMMAYQCCNIQWVQNKTKKKLFYKTWSLECASRLQPEGSLLAKGEMVIHVGHFAPNKLNVPGNVPRHCGQLARDCLRPCSYALCFQGRVAAAELPSASSPNCVPTHRAGNWVGEH